MSGNGAGPGVFEMIRMMNAKRQGDINALDTAARAGDIDAVDRYWEKHGTCSHTAEDKNRVVAAIINNPAQHSANHKLLGSITRSGFDFEGFFKSNRHIDEKKIFGLYADDAKPETAKAAAVLAAEYIRLKITADPKYKVDIEGIMATAQQSDGSLFSEAAFARLRDSVIAVQGALVAHVRDDAPDLPISRGAALLRFIEADIRAQGNNAGPDIWTRPITDFRKRTLEGARFDTIKYSPVFAP